MRKSGLAEEYARMVLDMYEDSGTVCCRSDRWVQSGGWDYIRGLLFWFAVVMERFGRSLSGL